MNRLLLSVSLAMIWGSPAFAQLVEQGTITPISAGTSQDFNQYFNEYQSRLAGEKGNRPFEGETFLHDQWKEYVLVVTFQKDPIAIDSAKYDSFSKEIVFQLGEETKYLTQDYVKAFWVRDSIDRHERAFINPRFHSIQNAQDFSMFEVLADGEISLYKETRHHFQGASGRYDPAAGGTEQKDRLVTEDKYYLVKSNTVYPIIPRSRFGRLLSTLTDDQFDVKGFAKGAGLRVNKVADWAALVDASNQDNQ